ncbi:MAG TPA: hypothetical protein PKJ15_05705, partial [Methanomassiliicoccales archaeon]|nr:hypothetical protein [Methanomassiliicoccales archaeon]
MKEGKVKRPPKKGDRKDPPAPPRAKPQAQMPQVQHDAILAGGVFTIIGGILMVASALLSWVVFEE